MTETELSDCVQELRDCARYAQRNGWTHHRVSNLLTIANRVAALESRLAKAEQERDELRRETLDWDDGWWSAVEANPNGIGEFAHGDTIEQLADALKPGWREG